MANNDEKDKLLQKKVKKNMNSNNIPNSASDSADKNSKESPSPKTSDSAKNGKQVLKKKLKLKPKHEDKIDPRTRLGSENLKTNVIDERTLHIQLEPEATKTPDFEKQTVEASDERIYYLTGKGKPHPVHELNQSLRELLLSFGFSELENQYFLKQKEIFEQYDTKSGLILDKTYYLAENQRQEIVLSDEQMKQLQKIMKEPEIDADKFLEILDEYHEYKIDFSQIFIKLKEDLNLSNTEINSLLKIVPQLTTSHPALTNTALRSTMDQAWLTTLAAIMDKENLPVKVFSSGIWFKREPKLNPHQLRSHYGCSCIIMDPDVTVNSGKIIAEEILEQLGIKELEFKKYDKEHSYNINLSELEIFSNGLKIATCGRISKRILTKFGIDIPVLYLNFGLEHLTMVMNGIDDIRELMYPQFYKAWRLDDGEIAQAIQFVTKPKTELGVTLASSLFQICKSNINVNSPCEFVVWDGLVNTRNGLIIPTPTVLSDLTHSTDKNAPVSNVGQKTSIDDANYGLKDISDKVLQEHSRDVSKGQVDVKKRLIVKVLKKDKDSKLCGPAVLNEIVVKNGEIYGVKNPSQNPDLAGAVSTNINYLEAFSKYVGAEIENKLINGELEDMEEIKAGIIKDMEDLNLQLDSRAVRFIITNKKKIDVRGPMFIHIEYQLTSANNETKVNDK